MISFIIASVLVVVLNVFSDVYTFRQDTFSPYGITNQVVIISQTLSFAATIYIFQKIMAKFID